MRADWELEQACAAQLTFNQPRDISAKDALVSQDSRCEVASSRPKTFLTSTFRCADLRPIGNESVPKIIMNDTLNLLLNCNQHFANFKP